MGNNNINKYPHIHVPFEMPCLKEKKVLSFDSFIVLSAIDWTSVNDKKKKIELLLKIISFVVKPFSSANFTQSLIFMSTQQQIFYFTNHQIGWILTLAIFSWNV